jgi:hypothetical protein
LTCQHAVSRFAGSKSATATEQRRIPKYAHTLVHQSVYYDPI